MNHRNEFPDSCLNQNSISRDLPSVVVLGGGIAGLSAAKFLTEAGYKVTLLEEQNYCGGFHHNVDIGPYTFDLGSIFYEANAQIFNLAANVKPMCSIVKREQRRVDQTGAIQRYPFNFAELGKWQKKHVLAGVLDLALAKIIYAPDGTLETMCLNRLGKTFYKETGLESYIERFNRISSRCVDESFFFYRMRQVYEQTKVKNIIQTAGRHALTWPHQQSNKPRPSMYVRPFRGFNLLFDCIQSELSEKGVAIHLSEQVQKITKDKYNFSVHTNLGKYEADSIVSSIPLDSMHSFLFNTSSGLNSLDLLTLFVSARHLDKESGNVIYNYGVTGQWKRATVYSRLYASTPTEREFFSVEITVPQCTKLNIGDTFKGIKEHMTKIGLARGLRLEGHKFTPNCYPLFTVGAQKTASEALERIAKTQILTIGRQGRFEYLPTSTGVIRRVFDELSKHGLM